MTKQISVPALLTIPALFITCTQESATPRQLVYDGLVDERLIPYFQTFVYEASIRGVKVDFDAFPIIGRIVEIAEEDIAGTCNYHNYEPNVVTIDRSYWNVSPTLRREMVVFHELGHCYLGRDHLETAFANGICTTVMNSGTSGCYVAYNAANRDYYLDELFGAQ